MWGGVGWPWQQAATKGPATDPALAARSSRTASPNSSGRWSRWGHAEGEARLAINRPAPTEERLLVIADAASRAGVSKRLEGLTLSPRGPGALAVRFSGGQHRFSAKGIDRYVAGWGAISRVTVPDAPPFARSRAASRMSEELDRREGRNRGKEGEVVAADGASQSTLNLHGVSAGTEPYRMR